MKIIRNTHKILFALVACSASAIASEVTVIDASDTPRLNGRIQYAGAPGGGAGSLKLLDQSLPQPEIRVGPSGNEGVGLAYLIAFQTDAEQRNQLLMAGKISLSVRVLKTAMGGSPEPLTVALLQTAGGADPTHFAQFGAWNDAPAFKEIGTIDGDPDIGEISFEITELFSASPPPTSEMPTIFFGIYAPVEVLKSENEGRHVIFGGEGSEAPFLEISE